MRGLTVGHDAAYHRRYYHANRERRLAQMKRYRQTFRGRMGYVADVENRRAKRRGLSGYVTTAELIALVEQSGDVCHWCGERLNGKLHIDHVIPLGQDGGEHELPNLVVSCPRCNVTRRHTENGGDE